MRRLWDFMTRNVWAEAETIGQYLGYLAGKREAEKLIELAIDENEETEFEAGLKMAYEILLGELDD